MNVGKVINGVCLFREAKDLILFLIEAVKSCIPNAGDATLVGVQADGIAVRSVHSIFLLGVRLRVGHDLLDKWAVIVGFRVNNAPVDNAALGKTFADGNGVYIVVVVSFLFGVEVVGLDELCYAALYLCP